jgi:hypothetical protein
MRLIVRGVRLVVVAVAVALLTAVPMTALLVHGAENDDECTPSVARHDPSEHHIRARAVPAGSPHCAICHWWVSSGRYKSPSLSVPQSPQSFVGFVSRAPAAEPQQVAFASRPARAPPVA